MNCMSEHALGTVTKHWNEPPWRVLPDDWPDVRPQVRTTAALLRGDLKRALCLSAWDFQSLHTPSPLRSTEGLWLSSQEQLLQALAIYFCFLSVASSILQSPAWYMKRATFLPSSRPG